MSVGFARITGCQANEFISCSNSPNHRHVKERPSSFVWLMHALRLYISIFLIALSPVVSAIEVRVLAHHPSRYNIHSTDVLKHALAYHGDKYTVTYLVQDTDLAREMELLAKGKLTVAWKTTSEESESKYLPVRVPIFGGLLAYRIMLIRPDMQDAFSRVQTYDDLKKFRFGLGEHWAEVELFEGNDLQVVESAFYYRLFDMLHHGRFDAFPRGITEPWTELKANADLDLVVESSILLSYKLPVYYFVAKNNPELAADIEYGMNRAIEDGSLRRLLNNDPDLVEGLKKLDLKHRKIFYLQNPYLPKETPVDERKYWISINDLIETALMSEEIKNAMKLNSQDLAPLTSD